MTEPKKPSEIIRANAEKYARKVTNEMEQKSPGSSKEMGFAILTGTASTIQALLDYLDSQA